MCSAKVSVNSFCLVAAGLCADSNHLDELPPASYLL